MYRALSIYMDSAMSPHIDSGVIFTNNLGQVIFVDQAFLDMMRYSEAAAIAGEPLFKALHLDQQSSKHLLEDVRQKGRIQDRPLEITDSVGGPLRVIIDSVATYDSNGNFLGADITLRRPTPADETS